MQLYTGLLLIATGNALMIFHYRDDMVIEIRYYANEFVTRFCGIIHKKIFFGYMFFGEKAIIII